jgi:hypothetical protein
MCAFCETGFEDKGEGCPDCGLVTSSVCCNTHVARKEHRGGRIGPGDTYRREVVFGYHYEDKYRTMRVSKTFVKRGVAS